MKIWRRSYDVPPPPLPIDDPMSGIDERYAGLPREQLPNTECLRDVVARMRPLLGRARSCPTSGTVNVVLIAAHGNSLRALVKHLDGMSDEAVVELDIPTGMPLVYELGADLRPINATDALGLKGRYLDPAAAAEASAAVKNQGR